MKHKNLVSHMETRKRKKIATTIDDGKGIYPCDLVGRKFTRIKPDELYYGDITYLPYGYNKNMFLATVIDACTKRVVGYCIDNNMRKELVIKALEEALKMKNTPETEPVIFHSDRGGQYRSNKLIKLCDKNGGQVKRSMGKTGVCYDNAPAESFFSTLKIECPQLAEPRYLTPTKIINIIENYIHFYNTERLHSTIGYLTPQQQDQKAA
jgi:putative transposase